MTFEDLSNWYLDLSSVKNLASYDRVCQCFKMFNSLFGDLLLNDIKQTDLEEYQIKRVKKGRANATVDMEIKIVQTAVTKAFDNDKIDGHCLKAFRKTKRLLETGANARKILITIEQYLKLLDGASNHYKAVLIIAFNTGMRLGEVKALKWSHIDKAAMMIRLPAEVTKENRTKDIPINHHVKSILDSLPVPINRDYVIKYMGIPLNGKSSLKKQFSETCQKVGIPHGRKTFGGIIFHDIRRTVKTNMLKAGVDKPHRDTIFGHSLKGMDAYYIVPTDESLTEAMLKYTVWLDEQIEVVSAIVSQNVSHSDS
jgi:integrase